MNQAASRVSLTVCQLCFCCSTATLSEAGRFWTATHAPKRSLVYGSGALCRINTRSIAHATSLHLGSTPYTNGMFLQQAARNVAPRRNDAQRTTLDALSRMKGPPSECSRHASVLRQAATTYFWGRAGSPAPTTSPSACVLEVTMDSKEKRRTQCSTTKPYNPHKAHGVDVSTHFSTPSLWHSSGGTLGTRGLHQPPSATSWRA